jgi:hypothetical protein
VFFVTPKITTVAILAAASANRGPPGGVVAGGIFLYALVAAGKSVESIKATVFANAPAPANKG